MPENRPAGFLSPCLRKPLNRPTGFKGLRNGCDVITRLYMCASTSTMSFCSHTRIFLQIENSVLVSVLPSIKYAATSLPFSKRDKDTSYQECLTRFWSHVSKRSSTPNLGCQSPDEGRRIDRKFEVCGKFVLRSWAQIPDWLYLPTQMNFHSNKDTLYLFSHVHVWVLSRTDFPKRGTDESICRNLWHE